MIRAGLLLDDTKVPLWVKETIDSLDANGIQLQFVVLNDSENKNRSSFSNFIYRTLRAIDRKIMSVKVDPFKRVTLNIDDVKIIKVKPVSSKYSDRFKSDDIEKIKNEQPDILLRFGFRILRGDILKVAKVGIVSLHHGDTDSYRGGPPAFWEVVNKDPVTAVTAQILTENLDNGIVLNKTYLRTDQTSFHRNQCKVYWAGKELLVSVLKDIASTSSDKSLKQHKENSAVKFYNAPLYKKPSNFISTIILLKWMLYNIKRKFLDLFYVGQWQLLYQFNSPGTLRSNMYRYKNLKPPIDRSWADPFILKKDKSWYVFFEEKFHHLKKAHISCLQMDEKGSIANTRSRVVLKEEHHLSYPFIFSYDGNEYMIPESSEAMQLNLYKCVSFPGKWEKLKTLIDNKMIYDATLHFYEGYWYLFCNSKENNLQSSDAYLHIFFCKDLLNDQFVAHPKNPIYRDIRRSRPAGKIFAKDGKLFRPSQIGSPHYGWGIKINRIIHLSSYDFIEEETDMITPDWDPKVRSIHTINNDEGLSVADIQIRKFKLFN